MGLLAISFMYMQAVLVVKRVLLVMSRQQMLMVIQVGMVIRL
jgi:hypothetical protein